MTVPTQYPPPPVPEAVPYPPPPTKPAAFQAKMKQRLKDDADFVQAEIERILETAHEVDQDGVAAGGTVGTAGALAHRS